MDDRFKLADDILEGVTGGVEITQGTFKKVTQEVDIDCPKCGKRIHQVFYSDGSMKYERCPNISCRNPLGVG